MKGTTGIAILLAACGVAREPVAVEPRADTSPSPGDFVVVGAVVFDGERFREGAVHVAHGRVVGIVDAPPPGVEIVRVPGHTLLPGLIDGHVHIGERVEHLERALSFGITTMVDLFGPPALPAQLRAEDLDAPGLRRAALFGVGNLATAPGGHGTEYGIPIPTLEAPHEAEAFVRARIAEGSSALKIVLDSSVADVGGAPSPMPTLSIETVGALVAAARARELPVVVHTGGCEDIRRVLPLRPDVVAHGCAIPEGDPLPALLAASGAYLNPTLAVQLRPCGMEYWIELVRDPELARRLTDEERERLGADRGDHDRTCSEGRLRLVGESARAGVRLIAGPDSPNRRLPIGASLLAEIELLRLAGATTEQALAAATSSPADAFRLLDRGRIAPGRRADLLLVEGDLRATPSAIVRTRAVWKAGQRVVGP